MTSLVPRQPVPELEVPTVDGGAWKLSESAPENFTMVAFYRGLHCPICAGYLGDLDRKRDDFRGLGVEAVMISSDDRERASETKEKWGIENLVIGYDLSIDKAREWGLFISTGRGKTSVGVEETAMFSEPGLFLVRPDGTLYASSVNTMPFARPNFGELLKAVDFIVAKDYPARGEA
ncbi:MAG: peroxiredoxin-like family protein [Rhodospirillales bacterium]|jgi:peroxiredoxin|nr:peroxiredoxin-like family protein [Rhodospirillales bacterium]MDP6773272.1 peroxiredoxin-like family protein [Rhodospirillales bacterium]